MKKRTPRKAVSAVVQAFDSINEKLLLIQERQLVLLNLSRSSEPRRFEVVLIGTGKMFGEKDHPMSMTLDGEVSPGETKGVTSSPDIDFTVTSFFILGDARITEIKMGNCVPVASSMSGLKFGLCNIKLTPANRISIFVEGL